MHSRTQESVLSRRVLDEPLSKRFLLQIRPNFGQLLQQPLPFVLLLILSSVYPLLDEPPPRCIRKPGRRSNSLGSPSYGADVAIVGTVRQPRFQNNHHSKQNGACVLVARCLGYHVEASFAGARLFRVHP